jgi:hypothetical protein
MAAKYPEIRRVQPMGNREHQAGRHNHCYTSCKMRSSMKSTRIWVQAIPPRRTRMGAGASTPDVSIPSAPKP